MFTSIIYPTNIENNMAIDNYDDREPQDFEAREERDEVVQCEYCGIKGSPEDMELDENNDPICPECMDDLKRTTDTTSLT